MQMSSYQSFQRNTKSKNQKVKFSKKIIFQLKEKHDGVKSWFWDPKKDARLSGDAHLFDQIKERTIEVKQKTLFFKNKNRQKCSTQIRSFYNRQSTIAKSFHSFIPNLKINGFLKKQEGYKIFKLPKNVKIFNRNFSEYYKLENEEHKSRNSLEEDHSFIEEGELQEKGTDESLQNSQSIKIFRENRHSQTSLISNTTEVMDIQTPRNHYKQGADAVNSVRFIFRLTNLVFVGQQKYDPIFELECQQSQKI